MAAFLNRYFKLDELQTNLRTEVVAGVSTYLSLAYILVVNPSILAHGGMDTSAVFFATIIASGLATLLMGFWAKLPFAVAPGLEMNGFFAFALCGTVGLTWQQGLGAVFWSGILCILATLSPARQKIIDSIPPGLKTNIAVSVGLFVTTIGLYLSKIVVFKKGVPDFTTWDLSCLATREALVLYIGLGAVALCLKRFRYYGMLVSIIISSIACWILDIHAAAPPHLSSSMFDAFVQFDLFSTLTDHRFLSAVLVLFIIQFYGSIGKFIGLTATTNLQSNGQVKNIEKALYVDGIGTLVGSTLGTSSLITFVESSVGITVGGRTGITAIVCGVLILASLGFTSLVGLVPVEATAGVLVAVGWLILPIRRLNTGTTPFTQFDLFVALGMGEISFLTLGLDKAMLIGFWAYTLRQIFMPGEKVNVYLLGTTILLTFATAMQYLWK